MALQQILQGSADQESFLAQAKFAAGGMAVIGVQHPVQGIGLPFRFRRRGVIPAHDRLEIHGLLGQGLPLSERGYPCAMMRRYDEIESTRAHAFGRNPLAAAAAVGFQTATGARGFHPSAEADAVFDAAAFDIPERAIAQPVIRGLHLHAVRRGLFEHAETVAQSIAEGRQFQFGEGVQKAGGKAAEAAVAQCGIGLRFQNIAPVNAALGHEGAERGFDAECRQGIAQRASHQKLHGKIMHAPACSLLAACGIGFLGSGPAQRQLIAAGFRRHAECGTGIQRPGVLRGQGVETGQHRVLQGVTGVGIQQGCGVIHKLAGGLFIIVGITPRRRH